MFKLRKGFCFLLLPAFFIEANAGNNLYSNSGLTASELEGDGWVVSVKGGPLWSQSGKTQTLYLLPDLAKTYTSTHGISTLGSGELFIGTQRQLSSQWLAQLGVIGAFAGNTTISGQIWDNALPQFNNYNYQYKVNNSRVGLEGKFFLDQGYSFMPWASVSLNVGFNHAYDFTNNSLISEQLAYPNFANNTKTSFTYTVGVGVEKNLDDHWSGGIGYEFADWGKSSLGRAPTQTVNQGLSLNHIYTNGFLLNLTYVH